MAAGAGPFHAGEIAMQVRAGVRDHWAGREVTMIRPAMPDQHREFFARLPTLLVGGLDRGDWPAATILAGRPGFVQSPDPTHLQIDALPAVGDPLAARLAVGEPVGLLGLEPATRRRNRANGRVADVSGLGWCFRVEQSFGNCPRYIQAREPLPMGPADGDPERGTVPPVVRLGPGLDPRARALIDRADTFFIASTTGRPRGDAPVDGIDVSHRGGPPGFVEGRIDRAGILELAVPDFDGNRLFNTLGNLLVNPRAGLLFIDYDAGDLLHIEAVATIGPEVAAGSVDDGPGQNGPPGLPSLAAARRGRSGPPARRWSVFAVRGGWYRRAALGLRWTPALPAREFG